MNITMEDTRKDQDDRVVYDTPQQGNRINYEVGFRNLTSGQFFGESALLEEDNSSPFTVITSEATHLLAVAKQDFNILLRDHFQRKMSEKTLLLSCNPLFSRWPQQYIRKLCFVLFERKFQSTDCIFSQCTKGEAIYFIKSGSIKLSCNKSKKPPAELLQKIDPPCNHLKEILQEEKEESGSRSRQHSTSELVLTRRKSTRLISLHTVLYCSKSPLQRVFKIHEPLSKTNLDLCTIGSPDILGGMEALCQLDLHLFTAVSLTASSVYELDLYNFESIILNKFPVTVHKLLTESIKKVSVWETRAKTMELLGPLKALLIQERNKLDLAGVTVHRHKSSSLQSKGKFASMLGLSAFKHRSKTYCSLEKMTDCEDGHGVLSHSNTKIRQPLSHLSKLSRHHSKYQPSVAQSRNPVALGISTAVKKSPYDSPPPKKGSPSLNFVASPTELEPKYNPIQNERPQQCTPMLDLKTMMYRYLASDLQRLSDVSGIVEVPQVPSMLTTPELSRNPKPLLTSNVQQRSNTAWTAPSPSSTSSGSRVYHQWTAHMQQHYLQGHDVCADCQFISNEMVMAYLQQVEPSLQTTVSQRMRILSAPAGAGIVQKLSSSVRDRTIRKRPQDSKYFPSVPIHRPLSGPAGWSKAARSYKRFVYMHTHIHTHNVIHTHVYVCRSTHTYTHTHIHTYTHTQITHALMITYLCTCIMYTHAHGRRFQVQFEVSLYENQ